MTSKPLRIYLDTSVFGGCFDIEFTADSKRLMNDIRLGRFSVIVTDLVIDELENSPDHVRQLFESLPEKHVEHCPLLPEIAVLRDAYLQIGVVGHSAMIDAWHVAAATVHRADALVSWNFKHIVRLDRMKAYNEINLHHGYGVLTIVSPKDVNSDESQV